jgi:hypothetical protein
VPVVLPFKPSVGNYQFRSVLSSVEYLFQVRWSNREQFYYFDVAESDGTPIVIGIKAVLGVYYGRVSTHPLFRQGVMAPRIPQGGDRREAQFDDFGVRVQVWYMTNAEVLEEILGNLQRGGP